MDNHSLKDEYNNKYLHISDGNVRKAMKFAKKTVQYTLNKINLIPDKNNQLSSLDVGCGYGVYTEILRGQGFMSHGLDFSEIAIKKAEECFPNCRFHVADGLNPKLSNQFDLIFCRGFSGANSYDLNYVADWANKYIDLLKPGGIFLLAFNSNFSGASVKGETVNWTYSQIEELHLMINAETLPIFFNPPNTMIRRLKSILIRLIFRRVRKDYFWLPYRKNSSTQ